MAFDEEHLDPHGECRHEIDRLKTINSDLMACVKREYDRHTHDAKTADFDRCGCDFCVDVRAAIARATT